MRVQLFLATSLFLFSTVCSSVQAGFRVTALGKTYAPRKDRTPIHTTRSNPGGSTSIRNVTSSNLKWKSQGYFQRNRDLGQVVVCREDFKLDAIVLRTGPSDSAVKAGAPGAELFLQFFEVLGSPRINDNGTGPGTDATHGFSKNHRCDDFIEGVKYRSFHIVRGGIFPDLPPTRDKSGNPTGDNTGKLHYFRLDLTDADELIFKAGKRYAFMLGFVESGPERAFTLGNYNAAGVNAKPSLEDRHDYYHDGWGLRREGDGSKPPTMTGSADQPSNGKLLKKLIRESLFDTPPKRFELSPTTDGYPDVDTYRDHEFYLEVYPAKAATRLMQRLRIGPNKRFLVREDGSAFVWIGATMWKWKDLTLDQIRQIIDDHSHRGYTVLQMIAYPDSYDRVDEIVQYAESKNMYMALLTGWYRDVLKGTEDQLYKRGRTLGARYSNNNNVIWLTAGEAGGHNRKGIIPDNKLEALVRGIRDGDKGDKLLTVHADYKRGTSIDNDTLIVDFDNWQTSQWGSPKDLPRNDPKQWTVWQAISHDYNRKPAKPTLDSEAWYENNKDHPGATPFSIRRRAYYTILAGGFGHTYGAGGIWDGLVKPQGKSGNWQGALKYEGYIHIGYLSEFLHSLGDDLLKLRPDQTLIVGGNSDSYDEHIQAAVATDKSFALVYSGDDDTYTLDLTRLKSENVGAEWYNPRENAYRDDTNSPYSCVNASQVFDPPGNVGPGNDWVLILQ